MINMARVDVGWLQPDCWLIVVIAAWSSIFSNYFNQAVLHALFSLVSSLSILYFLAHLLFASSPLFFHAYSFTHSHLFSSRISVHPFSHLSLSIIFFSLLLSNIFLYIFSSHSSPSFISFLTSPALSLLTNIPLSFFSHIIFSLIFSQPFLPTHLFSPITSRSSPPLNFSLTFISIFLRIHFFGILRQDHSPMHVNSLYAASDDSDVDSSVLPDDKFVFDILRVRAIGLVYIRWLLQSDTGGSIFMYSPHLSPRKSWLPDLASCGGLLAIWLHRISSWSSWFFSFHNQSLPSCSPLFFQSSLFSRSSIISFLLSVIFSFGQHFSIISHSDRLLSVRWHVSHARQDSMLATSVRIAC